MLFIKLVTTFMNMFTPRVGVFSMEAKQLPMVTLCLNKARAMVPGLLSTVSAILKTPLATIPTRVNVSIVVKVLFVCLPV